MRDTLKILGKYMLIGLAVTIVGLIAASFGFRVWGSRALRASTETFEREIGSLSIETFARPPIPAERNAVRWLRPGVLAVALSTDDKAILESVSVKRFSDWAPAERDAFEHMVERNRAAIEMLGRSRGMQEANWEVSYDDLDKVPRSVCLLPAVYAGRLLAARGRRAWALGDRDTALESVETLGVLARSYQRERMLIILLIGIALEQRQIALIREIATSPQVGRADLDRLETSLSDANLERAFMQSLRLEAAGMMIEAHRPENEVRLPTFIGHWFSMGVTERMEASVLDSYREAKRAIFVPVTEPVAEQDDFTGKKPWEKLGVQLSGAVTSSSTRGTATASARNLARIAIALRRGAIERGSYPETYEMPRDPLTGASYPYALRNGAAEVRSAATPEILSSIFPINPELAGQNFSWTLPIARRSAGESARLSPARPSVVGDASATN